MSETPELQVGLGAEVFDDEGNRLGTVQGFDEHGVYVTTDEGIAAMSREHVVSGMAGEAELTWRCYECGAIGDIDELPEDGCPDCGAPKEDVYYYVED